MKRISGMLPLEEVDSLLEHLAQWNQEVGRMDSRQLGVTLLQVGRRFVEGTLWFREPSEDQPRDPSS